MRGSKRWYEEEKKPDYAYKARFLMNGKPVVCGTSTMYDDVAVDDVCMKCGREVMCDPAVQHKPKLCILCAPK